MSLALGQDPSLIVFDSKKIRDHLKQCFKSGKLAAFPMLNSLRSNRQTRKKIVTVNVICICRRTEFKLKTANDNWDIEQCEMCREKFHRMCVKIPKTVGKVWLCMRCKRAQKQKK